LSVLALAVAAVAPGDRGDDDARVAVDKQTSKTPASRSTTSVTALRRLLHGLRTASTNPSLISSIR